MNLINTVRVKEINDERFTESGAGEQSTDTKSAIGGTRMSEAATPAVAAGNRVSTTRIVGGAGLALAASVVVQNAVFFSLQRPPSAILLVRSSPTTPRTGAPWPSPWVWRP